MQMAVIWTVVAVLAGCAGQATEPARPAERPARAAVASEPASQALLPDGPTEADFPHLHNLLQITERIYSGGEPKDEAAFDELARLGVRTIVSVDGARPNVDAAKRHGLRYVHVPIGYDGISDEAGKSLARLVQEAEGPFYIHCHHGKHRGPAAAAVACIADRATDGKSALAILQKAGTSKGYAGLWQDVEKFAPPADDVPLPELVAVTEVDSLAAAMAQIDRASDNLKLCQAAQWQTPPGHPDVAPAQQALLLKEGFRETVRQLNEVNDELNDFDEQFATWMREAEQSAADLETALNAGDGDAARRVFSNLQYQCKRCHREYRD